MNGASVGGEGWRVWWLTETGTGEREFEVQAEAEEFLARIALDYPAGIEALSPSSAASEEVA